MAVDESVSRDRIYTSVRARLFGTCGPWCARAALLRRLAVRPAEWSWVCPTSALSTNRLLVTRRDVPVAAHGGVDTSQSTSHHGRTVIWCYVRPGGGCVRRRPRRQGDVICAFCNACPRSLSEGLPASQLGFFRRPRTAGHPGGAAQRVMPCVWGIWLAAHARPFRPAVCPSSPG